MSTLSEKRCARCRTIKPLDQFSPHPKSLGKRQSECKPCRKDIMRQRRYGITRRQYAELLEFQDRKCAGCGATEAGGKGAFHVDHDHSHCTSDNHTCGNCVRGLLCWLCNSRNVLDGKPYVNWSEVRVHGAVSALDHFGEMNRDQAAKLLRTWAGVNELTDDERAQVIDIVGGAR